MAQIAGGRVTGGRTAVGRGTTGQRIRAGVALWALAEIAAFAVVAHWAGFGLTVLAVLATSAVGASLLGRSGARALGELRRGPRGTRGRALGDAGLGVVGGLLLLVPGFLGDLVGLACLVPGVRALPRAVGTRLLVRRVPQELQDRLRGPVRVRSSRGEPVRPAGPVIEGRDRRHPGDRRSLIRTGPRTRNGPGGLPPGPSVSCC